MPRRHARVGLVLLFGMSLLGSCGKPGYKQRVPETPDFPGDLSAASDWFNLDGTLGGINVDKVYAEETFEHEIIVAVIDSGVSPTHEDLKDHLWINPKEIPGNEVDDDGNGYVDDIHGWNYLVAHDGSTIHTETFEVSRELRRLTLLQKERPLSDREQAYLLEVQSSYEQAKAGNPGSRQYDLDWQQRADDLYDFTPIDAEHPAYGNNEIFDQGSHGTHVAGIIAASRHNKIGIRGIAEPARIMVLRAVPNGDEIDKDIYHAVRYAVDQGAHVINMSFGKDFSPNQDKVQEAFQYAYEHNVLLVHAAGNAAYDMDQAIFYPSRAANSGMPFNEGWLDVGAVGQGELSPLAYFSNYGKSNVDIFAPGVNINSCVPGNSYAAYSGTSMAAPVVAGAAALMLSRFPELKVSELRKLMLESARTSSSQGHPLRLRDKAIAGGVIDAYALMQRIRQRPPMIPLKK